MTLGTPTDKGYGVLIILTKHFQMIIVTIPTGIDMIDDVLRVVLQGELGVIIGPSSFGKVQPSF